jgi:TetR/AcrR family transcriptional regulator, regulator of biofilm formation and stress response
MDSRGERTRERLLAATAEVIARDGWDAATARKIASDAGVNAGLINYHFGSKANLMLAALEATLEAEVAAPLYDADDGAEPEPPAVVAHLVRVTLGPQISAHARRVFESALAAIVRDPDLAAALRPTVYRFRGLLSDFFDRAIAAGRTPPTDTEALAILCTAMLDGLWLHSLIDPNLPTERIAEEATRLLGGEISP